MATSTSNLALPAQIMRAGRQVCSITISGLSEDGCLASEDLPAAIGDASFQLWLGAIGPLDAHRSPISPAELEFDGPINPAIVAHFNS